MNGHYIEKCRECGTVVSQCRCPARDKVERLVTCENCKTKEFEPDSRPSGSSYELNKGDRT